MIKTLSLISLCAFSCYGHKTQVHIFMNMQAKTQFRKSRIKFNRSLKENAQLGIFVDKIFLLDNTEVN